MSAEPAVYLDSSALVKLVVRDAESDALRRYLRGLPSRVSCALSRVEVVRAVRAQGGAAVGQARRLLERTSILVLDDPLLESAAALDDGGLRSLDAIHLAAALALGDELAVVVTYDVRMTQAASSLRVPVASPR